MPFYDGKVANVISVYESPHQFQGFFAQSKDILNTYDFDHVLVVADDLILNPRISESNYWDFFGLNKDSDFIPDLTDMSELRTFWMRSNEAASWEGKSKGAKVLKDLPDPSFVIEKTNRNGITHGHVSVMTLFRGWQHLRFLSAPVDYLRRVVESIGIYCQRKFGSRRYIRDVIRILTPKTIPTYPMVGEVL